MNIYAKQWRCGDDADGVVSDWIAEEKNCPSCKRQRCGEPTDSKDPYAPPRGRRKELIFLLNLLASFASSLGQPMQDVRCSNRQIFMGWKSEEARQRLTAFVCICDGRTGADCGHGV